MLRLASSLLIQWALFIISLLFIRAKCRDTHNAMVEWQHKSNKNRQKVFRSSSSTSRPTTFSTRTDGRTEDVSSNISNSHQQRNEMKRKKCARFGWYNFWFGNVATGRERDGHILLIYFYVFAYWTISLIWSHQDALDTKMRHENDGSVDAWMNLVVGPLCVGGVVHNFITYSRFMCIKYGAHKLLILPGADGWNPWNTVCVCVCVCANFHQTLAPSFICTTSWAIQFMEIINSKLKLK